jgi:lipoprotein-releasing system permease protein
VSDLDPGFRARMTMVEGTFDLADPAAIILGVELARHLGAEVGDTVSVLALGGESFDSLSPVRRLYRVTGLFRSGYYEYDLGWAFVRLVWPVAGGASEPQIRYGIKIRNRFRDEAALRAVRAALGSGPYRVGSWREFNRAFFAALRMEKLLMMILIGLIFVVVGFNIYHSLRRSVRERFEEIGVLKALGASQGAVESIFLTEGFLIGLLGGGLGLALGLLLAANINTVFRAVETVTNLVLELAARLVVPLAGGERFALFSPTYFYLSEVPSRVLFPEAFLVVAFALGSCVLAALFASSSVRQVLPAEVLRYE